jgi:hypothetical protein
MMFFVIGAGAIGIGIAIAIFTTFVIVIMRFIKDRKRSRVA